jgi:hypothetical protein
MADLVTAATNLTPDPEAQNLAQQMLAAHGVQETVLTETIESAEEGRVRESGRTVCSPEDDPIHPRGRYRTSVSLASCPRNRGGTFHSHVTQDQLRNPENSLPDMANIVYGNADVSVVVGTRGSEAFYRAEDEKAMRTAFEEAVGGSFNSADGLVQEILSGTINPPEARDRVQSRLSPLFSAGGARFPELDERVASAPVSLSQRDFEMEEAFTFMAAGAQNRSDLEQSIRDISDNAAISGAQLSRWINALGLKEQALSTGVGVVVGELVNQILFNR